MRLDYQIKYWLEGVALEIERVFLKVVIKVLGERIVDPENCEHEWEVHSVNYDNVWLELMCFECNSDGVVKDPNSDEWSDAYGASTNPYLWEDKSRVTYVRCFGNTGASENYSDEDS